MRKKVLISLMVILGLVFTAGTLAIPAVAQDAQQQEEMTVLKYLQSSEKGRELLKMLPKEAIDEFAITLMPPPAKPQPVGYGGCKFISSKDIKHVPTPPSYYEKPSEEYLMRAHELAKAKRSGKTLRKYLQ